MSSMGQKYVKEAQKWLGLEENPWGSNTGGPIFDPWSKYAGYSSPVPWCGVFTKAMASKQHGMNWPEMESMTDGYTGYSVQRAKDKGWLKKGGASTPTGALFIKGGSSGHVGIVVTSSSTTFTTVEGNANKGVRSYTRSWSDGWQAIVPPSTGTAQSTAMYGFDDLSVKPTRYGGWPTAKARDEQMALFAAANPDKWTRAIRIDTKSPYAFEAGAKGTYGKTWKFGGWSEKSVRDKQLSGWQSKPENAGKPTRTWRTGSEGSNPGKANDQGVTVV